MAAVVDRDHIAFLDVEATGMQGLPIEVGISAIGAGDRVQVDSKLVWSADEEWQANVREMWDYNAAAMHGITIEMLEEQGIEPAAVAAWLKEALSGRTVIVTSPFDRQWIDEIFSEAKRAGAPGRQFEIEVLPEYRGSSAHHRAGPDAEEMARAWLRVHREA